MLVFILHIVKQVDKFVHLNVNLIKSNQMKSLNLISYQQVFGKFEKLFYTDFNYYPFHLMVIIFLYISLVVLDIGINKLVGFFFFQYVHLC
jgi:hypothetical protein